MKFRAFAAKATVTSSILLLFGVGCGSTGGGGGCGGLKPLPSANGQPSPAPLGLPSDQVIEGGMQARITKPGMDKLIGAVVGIVSSGLKGGICIPQIVYGPGSGCNAANVGACGNGTCGGAKGCSASLVLTSPDGKDKITAGISDGDNPVVHIDAKFDVHVPLDLDYNLELLCIGTSGSCTMDIASKHFNDASQNPLEITADIQTGIDPATGELTLNLAGISLVNLGFDISGCSVLGTFLQGLVDLLNTTIGNALTNIVLNLIKPQINTLLQSLLPKPPGVAGVLDTGTMLASFNPPKDAGLEMFVVAGGYVKGKTGGLNLGVMSGVNSDRDEKTRTPGLTSEPSLCVPVRPTPQLGQNPWMLPANPGRKDFLLSPANEFSGSPDPTDPMGNIQDVAIGLSRTFLDLVGFHVYNSGTLCLDIGGSAIPQLNAGTLSVIVGSLGNVIEDRKAPLTLVLRPQTPLTFTVGAGDMNDPLIHIGISDMRIDFYAWMEERYVRLLTMAVDINVGLNLTVTKDANMKPAIQPMLVGVDAKNVTIRVSNTDLLQETPAALEAVFPSLINIATGALGGVVKPIALPAVAGFSLDNLKIQRVQTSQDDFVAIYGTIITGTPAPLIDWSNPNAPRTFSSVRVNAAVAELKVPSANELQANFGERIAGILPSRPTVKLALGTIDNVGLDVEYAWRVDNGFWRPWTRDSNPTLQEDAFLLQGHHKIDVRSRVVNDWSTESEPVSLDVLIDSVPPELHPARNEQDHSRFDFGGFDVVSDADKLQYAWAAAGAERSEWSSTSSMRYDQASEITLGGARKLVLYAKDEAGNVASAAYDLGSLEFHGRSTAPSAGGCGCFVAGRDGDGGARGAMLAMLVMALVLLRRRAQKAAPYVIVCALAFVAAGCGCDNKNQCKIDDDCAKMMCDTGQVPACMGNQCGCIPDIPPGDVGRFSSMALIGTDAYVAAYNNTYGDLMIGHITPPGVVSGWDFVDGVPDEAPDVANSHNRGGISDKGDDVGRYTSVAKSSTNEPIIAYYDLTHGALKFASFGAIRWHSHVVDVGVGAPSTGGDDVGRWTSMTIGPDGKPAIAYSAWVKKGVSGMPESQLRWAQANTTTPTSQSDWTITVIDSRLASSDGAPPSDMGVGPDMAMPPPDMAGTTPPDVLLPEGIALMASAARKMDGSPGITYYDRTRGNLRYVEWNPTTMMWNKPVVLDGEDAMGNDLGDVGLYSSLTYDGMNVAHISYENATKDSLFYMNTKTKMPELVDDGYHPKDEQTQDGIDSPVWHLVGDSSSIQEQGGTIVVAYQDSTVLMLRLAIKGADGKWSKQYVAGHAMPFMGSYGFYANLKVNNGQGVLSTYAINQQLAIPSFYVEVFAVNLGIIQ